MAEAFECDRCKKLFSYAYISQWRIHRWSPAHGGIPFDLCPGCSKELDAFFKLSEEKEKEDTHGCGMD